MAKTLEPKGLGHLVDGGLFVAQFKIQHAPAIPLLVLVKVWRSKRVPGLAHAAKRSDVGCPAGHLNLVAGFGSDSGEYFV